MLRLTLILFVSASICFGLYAFVPHATVGASASSFVILANIFGLTVGLLWNASSATERSAEYVFYIYMTLFYLIPGYVHVSENRFPFYGLTYPDDYVLMTAIAVLTFSIIVAIAYRLTESCWREENSGSGSAWSGGLTLISLLYASLGVVIAITTGLKFYITPRGEIDTLISDWTPLLAAVLTSPRVLSFVALVVSIMGFKRHRSGWSLCVCIYSSAIFALVNAPLAISRFVLFSYIITVLIVFTNIMVSRKVLLLVVWFVAQLTIFPMISDLSRGDITDFFESQPLEYFFSSGDFDGFQSTINVLIYAEKTGLHWGGNLLSAILFFVPRAYWESKSHGTGVDAAIYLGYHFFNVSAPLPSEFYIDFGFIGVIIGAALFGYVLARIDRAIRGARRSKDELRLFVGATVVGYLAILLRGSLVGVVAPFVMTYAVVWITRQLIILFGGLRGQKAWMGPKLRRGPELAGGR
jgi:oligosaccharide repeat unit polymerase